jgi:dihydrofolate reductase
MERPRCSAHIAASMDGFIARADGGLDWLDAVQRPGEDYGFAAFFASVEALLLGRNTWEVARRFEPWPYGEKRCVVLTNRPAEGTHGELFHAGDPAPLLARLHAEGVKRAYVDGGVTVARFLAAGLIDDITVSLIPVLLGDGIRLFPGGHGERLLELTGSRSFPSGLVQVDYRVLAAP